MSDLQKYFGFQNLKNTGLIFLLILFFTGSLFAVNPNNPVGDNSLFGNPVNAWEVDTGITREIHASINGAASTVLSDPTMYSFGPKIITSLQQATVAWISINKTTGQRFLYAAFYSFGWSFCGQISANTEDILPDIQLNEQPNFPAATIVYRAIDLNTNQVVIRSRSSVLFDCSWPVTNIYPSP